MAKLVEYTGSDEQNEEIQKSEHGWMTEDFIVIDGSAPIHDLLCIGDKYLICDPHPYADEIKIWADTGCEVWWRMIPENHVGLICRVFKTNKPDWNIPGAEYRLTPFED